MANNIVAYIGWESFDIILYLSRILLKLGHRVLLIDNSQERTLADCMPCVPGIDTASNCITYRGIDFTTRHLNQELEFQYDDIFIHCGMSMPQCYGSNLTRLIVTTNLLPSITNEIVRIGCLMEYEDKLSLLIRDVIDTHLVEEGIRTRIGKHIPESSIFMLYRDDSDYMAGLLCQANQICRFYDISSPFKNYLFKEVQELSPQVTIKQIKKAYRLARKGE